jgi:hypothetical protein
MPAQWHCAPKCGSDWEFPENGAPAAQHLDDDGDVDLSISWMASKRLIFEHCNAVPFEVLAELVRRGKKWHWTAPPVTKKGPT